MNEVSEAEWVAASAVAASKRKVEAELAADIARFLASGGRIQHIESGTGSGDIRMINGRTEEEHRAKARKAGSRGGKAAKRSRGAA